MIAISKYNPSMAAQWDDLVVRSSTGTFLHFRDYMDYHSLRFHDHSLLASDEKGRLVAVLPACRRDDVLTSHAGLTYGGWLTDPRHVDAGVMLEIFDATIKLLRAEGVKELIYKPVPTIYHLYPAQDDLYALYRLGARPVACALSQTIDLRDRVPFDRGNKSNVNKAVREGLTVERSEDFDAFWPLLEQVLMERHALKPVHTVDEIKLLHSRFREYIKLWIVHDGDTLLAGTVMFYTLTVAHSQYIASGNEGRRRKALPLLFHHVIENAADEGFRYFDFGVSTEDGGRVLNHGLMEQKSRMGGRGTVYNTFSLKF